MIPNDLPLSGGGSKTIGKRGFVTIATGDQKYYELALNLLRSYRVNGNSSVPFALLCDRDCPIAREFDDMVLLPEPNCSYLDKLSLYQYIPYEETIFIDADALIMGDADVLWQDFQEMDDFSAYGWTLPLDSPHGWFFYDGMGELQSQLSYSVHMHGGLYYLRKTERCRQIFAKAMEYAKDYHKYSFANFKNPADEPVLALAMVVSGGKPCPKRERIAFVPGCNWNISISREGKIKVKGMPANPVIVHFGNKNIPCFLYQWQLAIVNNKYVNKKSTLPGYKVLAIRLQALPFDANIFIRKLSRRIIPQSLMRTLKGLLKR